MSTLEVNKITPVSGETTIQVGESGDTINIPAGATIANAGTATGFGVSLANGADNRVVTASSASALNGEANLTYDGTQLSVLDTNDGTDNLLVKTTGDNQISMALEKSDFKYDLGLDHNNDGSQNFYIRERHQGGSTTNAVRLTIDASGNILMGKTSNNWTADGIQFEKTSGTPKYYFISTRDDADEHITTRKNNTTGSAIKFYYNSTLVGNITHTTSSTSYGTSSDYRLKENEVAISDGIERLKQLKPYRFNFKADANKTVDGFFAHEVSSIVPEAVQGEKDAVDSEGNINPQGIDQSKLVPLLTSALQEAITKIETLEARVQALESA